MAEEKLEFCELCKEMKPSDHVFQHMTQHFNDQRQKIKEIESKAFRILTKKRRK